MEKEQFNFLKGENEPKQSINGDLENDIEKSDLALISKSELTKAETLVFNNDQVQFLLTKTQDKFIKKRKGPSGTTLEYVTGGYIKKCLNLIFGFHWTFECTKELTITESVQIGQVIVKGRLTCHVGDKAKTILIKEQYGRKNIAYFKESKIPVDFGNDMKAAATDALKKCASEIGIASDIYNKEEFKEVFIDDVLADDHSKYME